MQLIKGPMGKLSDVKYYVQSNQFIASLIHTIKLILLEDLIYIEPNNVLC